MTGRTEANHRFLVLRQPIAESDFPSPRIFEAGRTYQFPFLFAIPEQLLPKCCSHDVTSDQVRACHLMLPPSLGDAELAGFGSTLLDDLAPAMSKIVYMIKCRIAHQRGTEGISVLGEKIKKVRIKPALSEQPPLDLDGSKEYRPYDEKTVRKGLFKGKLGTLSTRTIQPKPLVLPGRRAAAADVVPITTMAKLLLRFDPAEEVNDPPKLGSLATKIKVTTHYASSPRKAFPNRATFGFDVSQGMYAQAVPLANLCIASAPWEKHSAEENIERRDSGVSEDLATVNAEAVFAAGILPASKDYKNGTFYTAQILVPITLPTNKNFIPTFHSCLVSRTYTLNLQFAAHGSSSFNLKVPIQICAEGTDTGIANARARSIEDTVLREAADVWTPRSVAPPSFDEINTGSRHDSDAPPSFAEINLGPRSNSLGARDELPPDYAAFAPPARRYRASIAA
jgi:hypothetical protein